MSETSDDRMKTDIHKHVLTHMTLTKETADVFTVQTVKERFNTFQLNVLPILTVSLSVEHFMIMVLFLRNRHSKGIKLFSKT